MIKSNLLLPKDDEFANDEDMKKTLPGFSLIVNQGGLLFLRQAKGIQLNLSQDNARFSKSFIGVNRTGTQAAKSITRGSAIRVRSLFD